MRHKRKPPTRLTSPFRGNDHSHQTADWKSFYGFACPVATSHKGRPRSVRPSFRLDLMRPLDFGAMSTCQYITARNTLSCMLVLIAAFLTTVARSADEIKFPHLLKQFGDESPTTNRRLHLISEVVQGDHKIQVEEYLDLNTYSQLIQLKWHHQTTTQQHSTMQLTTHKINVLILNGKDQSALYQYKPFECTSVALDGQNHPDTSWKLFDLSGNLSSPLSTEEQAGALLAKSIVSTALDSPYLVGIPAGHGDVGGSSHRAISGIAGLWLAAEFANNGEHPEHPKQAIAGSELRLNEGVWRLNRAPGLVIDYYTQRAKTSKPTRGRSSEWFERPELIVVRHENVGDDHANEDGQQQTINVFKLELDYSDQLAENLFTLPIGFDCPANPLLSPKGLYFGLAQGVQMMQFELVASRTRLADGPLVDVRTIEIAQVRHPLDANSRLTMFGSREDHYKAIQDHSYKLEYKLLQVPGSASSQAQCIVEHLQFDHTDDNDQQQQTTTTTNTNQIRFNVNKLQLELSEFHLNFLLGISAAAGVGDTQGVDSDKMRLLNRFDTSDTQSELVFESEVPPEHLNMLADLTGTHCEFQMRIVRVYEQRLAKSAHDPSTKIRRGALKLVRVLLLVFDAARSEKLAEVRLNLLEDQQILSWTQRAQLFDLTRCRNLEEESMQLVVRYPAEPALLEYVDEHPSLLLHRFYGAATDWTTKVDAGKQRDAADVESQELAAKRRLGASLNYLRVPRAELRRAPGGDLEMHLTILEAISPLDSFEFISGATFTIGGGDLGNSDELDFEQPLLVGSVRECARLCQNFGCKVFAFEPSRECRMTHLALQDRDLSCVRQRAERPAEEEDDGKSEAGRRIMLDMLPMSELYFEPQHLRDRAGPDEATLAELSSYISHASYDIEAYEEAASESDDRDPVMTSRQKRQASPESMPLFAFDFIDRSGAQSEYAPPAMRLLVPSAVTVRHLPLVLNLARDGPQMERVSRSFSVRYAGKAYTLNALDATTANGDSPGDGENERLFRDVANEVYYNLKRVASISQDNCALLCYNIEEFNAQTGGEQTCISFSYSVGDEQCVLLVKTDFKFLEKPNVVDEEMAHEGDRVLELNGPSPIAGGSLGVLDQLMIKCIGGVVAFRNYLPEFQGPLRIDELASGDRATQAIEEEYLKRGLELEWLNALVVETGSQKGVDIRERCAQKCLERNRGLKRALGDSPATEEMCLAFDHCVSSKSLKQQEDNSTSIVHHKQECRLLIIRGEQLRTGREHIKPIRALRSQLARPANSKPANSDNLKANTCNRYILSHLYEFNHLSQRQVLTSNAQISSKLEKSSETSYDSNLDSCALECSLRSPADCLMFEFCQSVKVTGGDKSERTLERNCTMFRRTDLRSGATRDGVGSQSDENLESTQTASSVFHKDCHVYVRRQFNSIEQALSDETLEKLAQLNYGPMSRKFEHFHLVVGFSIVFLIATAGLMVLVVHLNRRQSPTTGGASRQDVAIMMTEINNRLART